MIFAIVLDIGGVIIRTKNPESRKQLEEKFNLLPGSVHDLVFNSATAQSATIGQINSSQIWKNISNKLSLTPDELEQFITLFWAGDRLDTSLISFLESCRPRYKTALLSNAWGNFRDVLAREYNIREGKTVDHILISAELGVAKPDPRIYQILADTLACKYEEILFVDDFIENINAARSLGIHTIHYYKGLDLINAIKLKVG